MSKNGHGVVTRDWGDGTYTFRLDFGAWPELQEKCKCGPATLLKRVAQGEWLVEYLDNIVRLGLIGGGTEPAEALKLVRRYVRERPLTENVELCIELLLASLYGPKVDEAAGEMTVTTENVDTKTTSSTSN